MPHYPERHYGLGDPTSMLRGKPRIVGELPAATCPHCECARLFKIEIDVENPLLKGGKGIGTYIGCAACPWASPMLMQAL
jgi:hypothetical protein